MGRESSAGAGERGEVSWGLALVDAASRTAGAELEWAATVQVIPYGSPSLEFRRSRSIPGRRTRSRQVAVRGLAERVVGGDTGDSLCPDHPLLGTSWGSQAVQNAEALGVNPISALAATCVPGERLQPAVRRRRGAGCIPDVSRGVSGRKLAAALAANPGLQSQIISGAAGMNDPTTEAIAASGYLMRRRPVVVQNSGIADPTVTQSPRLLLPVWTCGWHLALANASP